MTIDELAQECRDKINQNGPEALVLVYYPNSKWGKTNYRRLCKGGPKGNIKEAVDGGLIVEFKAQEIIDFLKEQSTI